MGFETVANLLAYISNVSLSSCTSESYTACHTALGENPFSLVWYL